MRGVSTPRACCVYSCSRGRSHNLTSCCWSLFAAYSVWSCSPFTARQRCKSRLCILMARCVYPMACCVYSNSRGATHNLVSCCCSLLAACSIWSCSPFTARQQCKSRLCLLKCEACLPQGRAVSTHTVEDRLTIWPPATAACLRPAPSGAAVPSRQDNNAKAGCLYSWRGAST